MKHFNKVLLTEKNDEKKQRKTDKIYINFITKIALKQALKN